MRACSEFAHYLVNNVKLSPGERLFQFIGVLDEILRHHESVPAPLLVLSWNFSDLFQLSHGIRRLRPSLPTQWLTDWPPGILLLRPVVEEDSSRTRQL